MKKILLGVLSGAVFGVIFSLGLAMIESIFDINFPLIVSTVGSFVLSGVVFWTTSLIIESRKTKKL